MIGYLYFALSVIGLTILFLSYIVIKAFRDYHIFQKTMKVNTPCCFYINESRETGTIVSINENNTVTIEDSDGDLHVVIAQDVYPFRR